MPLIGQQFFREAVICFELIPEGSCSGFSRLIGGDISYFLSCKVVTNYQNIHNGTCMRFFYCQKVHVD